MKNEITFRTTQYFEKLLYKLDIKYLDRLIDMSFLVLVHTHREFP